MTLFLQLYGWRWIPWRVRSWTVRMVGWGCVGVGWSPCRIEDYTLKPRQALW